MPLFSLNQAARQSKKSKATLLDAIRSGRLSAAKDDQGRYQIDPAELFRVYPVTGSEPVAETGSDRPQETTYPPAYQDKTSLLERLISHLEDERDDLRARLDKSEAARESAASEIRRLTLMLTHQPDPQADPPKSATQNRERLPARDGFWIALVLALFAVAAAWYFSPWEPK